jgi:hypothetical protein
MRAPSTTRLAPLVYGFAEGLATQIALRRPQRDLGQRRAFVGFPDGLARQDKTAHQAGFRVGTAFQVSYSHTFPTFSTLL